MTKDLPHKNAYLIGLLSLMVVLVGTILSSSTPSFATAALLPSGTPSPETSTTPTADVLYEQSRVLYQAGRVTAALAKLNILLENTSSDDTDAIVLFRAYFLRGQIYLERGNIVLAISDLTTAIGYQPEIAEVYVFGSVRISNKRISRLLSTIILLAIEYDDSESTHYINRGLVYMDLENYRLAIADFSEAIVLNPDDPQGYVLRGEAYLLQENYVDALSNLDTAIGLDPEDAKAYQLRGLINSGLGQNEAALDDFQTYLELAPDADDREAIEAQIQGLQSVE